MNEIKEKLNLRRGSPCSWRERYNNDKMSALPNLIYRVNDILKKTQKANKQKKPSYLLIFES